MGPRQYVAGVEDDDIRLVSDFVFAVSAAQTHAYTRRGYIQWDLVAAEISQLPFELSHTFSYSYHRALLQIIAVFFQKR